VRLAFTLGKSMQRTGLTYRSAPSDAELVVGDQPIVNLAAPSDPRSSPEQLVMYFPVSPTLAAVVDFDASRRSVDNGTLEAARVSQLNQRMAEVADTQVFAASRVALEALAPATEKPPGAR